MPLSNAPVAGVESPRAGGFISSEAQGTQSRDIATLLAANDSSTSLVAGTVVGRAIIGTAGTFATASSGFTCGTITLSAGVKPGVYTGQCVVAGATGKFQVEDPDGLPLATLTVGTAYTGGGLGFTLSTAGGNAALGDQFTITVGTAAFANGAGITGNGTCSAITVLPGVEGGVYTFTATSATKFSGVSPLGLTLPELTVGTAYTAGGISFTITAGGTAYVAGDTFTITTNVGSGKYSAVSSSGANGTQFAAGILVAQQYIGGSADVKAAIVSRNAEVKRDALAWPSAATDSQIRAWIVQLAKLGIIVREDY